MNKPEDSGSRSVLRTGARLHQRRSLQEANAVSLQLSGNQLHQSTDPHGQVLRQLRQAQKLDPSSVATQACISLGQLYELETGGRRLFYSEALRTQAARRVASLLHSDWDAIVAGQIRPEPAGQAWSHRHSPLTGGQVIPLRPPPQTAHHSQSPDTAHPVTHPAPQGQDAHGRSQSLPPAGTRLLSTPTQPEAPVMVSPAHEEPSRTVTPSPSPDATPGRRHLVLRTLLGILFGLLVLVAARRAGLFTNVQLPL